MPMFYTPKPRQFRYQPRFYDPEREKWEALKAKYALERELEETRKTENEVEVADIPDIPDGSDLTDLTDGADNELAYFQRRVREIEREEKRQGLTWKDLFRKREMPTFNYQPRFSASEKQQAESGEQGTGEHLASFKKRNAKIKRRFDVADKDYMKPVPATRIMLYTLLVCLLLYWILF